MRSGVLALAAEKSESRGPRAARPESDGRTPSSVRSSPRHVLLHCRLPVFSIERFRRDGGEVDVVEAARIDVDLVGIGARHIERMDAAVPAEHVLRGPGIELVDRQITLAAEQLELLRRHDQVQNSFFGADRAIAFGHGREIRGNAVTPTATMTPAFLYLLFRQRQ